MTGSGFVGLLATFYYRMLNNKHFFLHLYRATRLHKTKVNWLQKLELKIEEVELMAEESTKIFKKMNSLVQEEIAKFKKGGKKK